MKPETKRRLEELFLEVDSKFSDKSTAFILEVTAERARIMGIKRDCDCSDVAEVLAP